MLYQSRLYEGDTLQTEAVTCIEKCRDKLIQREFNEWNTSLDMLKAERKKLLIFERYDGHVSAEIASLSAAEKYKINAERFCQTSRELAALCESRKGRHDGISGSLKGNAPSQTSFSVDVKDMQQRSNRASPGGSTGRVYISTPENALGLHFNRRSFDRSQRTNTSSTGRSMSLKSVLSSLLLPLRGLSNHTIAEDTNGPSEDQAVESTWPPHPTQPDIQEDGNPQ